MQILQNGLTLRNIKQWQLQCLMPAKPITPLDHPGRSENNSHSVFDPRDLATL
jgi:hypothetical protein